MCSARIGKQQRVSVAIKACTLRRCDIERYSERILILQKICHPNAVQFYGVVELSGGSICIVTEACHRLVLASVFAATVRITLKFMSVLLPCALIRTVIFTI